jgi:drug/metabolite transporter (DMT)-like permease
MVPAFGVLGAMLFLGERPTPPDYLGLVFIVAAAPTVVLPPSPGPQPPPEGRKEA